MLQTKGNKDGKETVLMFVNDVISSVLTPTKQLKGFEKVFIKAGETVTVNLKLNIKGLAIVTRDLEYIVEKGKFEIMVGRNTKEYLKRYFIGRRKHKILNFLSLII